MRMASQSLLQPASLLGDGHATHWLSSQRPNLPHFSGNWHSLSQFKSLSKRVKDRPMHLYLLLVEEMIVCHYCIWAWRVSNSLQKRTPNTNHRQSLHLSRNYFLCDIWQTTISYTKRAEIWFRRIWAFIVHGLLGSNTML